MTETAVVLTRETASRDPSCAGREVAARKPRGASSSFLPSTFEIPHTRGLRKSGRLISSLV